MTGPDMSEISWLPDKRFYEYAYHKHFNPDVMYQNWSPWDQWEYPDRDVLRFEHIIKNQDRYIRGKHVLDIGCHLGYISLFCLHNGAKSVTGTNIRSQELDIAREICQYAGYTDFDFIHSDIYDLCQLKQLCNRHDTAILSGIMYHVNNHYSILTAISESSISNIIIESLILDDEPDIPNIRWIHENSLSRTNGLFKNKTQAFVGIPNYQWFEQALMSLDFKIVYNQLIEYTKPNGNKTRRCIISATRIIDDEDSNA
jgi:SAM-dependent methyltransferase